MKGLPHFSVLGHARVHLAAMSAATLYIPVLSVFTARPIAGLPGHTKRKPGGGRFPAPIDFVE